MKLFLTRPFLPDQRQFWLSPPLLFWGAFNHFLVRPSMPQDEFLLVVCLCFAFVFAFNAVLDVTRMPFLLRRLAMAWFLFLLFLLPVTLWAAFHNAVWYSSHPMPDGGFGAR
ncbi:hypothetical protein IAD21_03601 [Abditibacteriota bacterium]|nr:hypothetical protein IAD21_03601 [Abditibacteriota bacterium]